MQVNLLRHIALRNTMNDLLPYVPERSICHFNSELLNAHQRPSRTSATNAFYESMMVSYNTTFQMVSTCPVAKTCSWRLWEWGICKYQFQYALKFWALLPIFTYQAHLQITSQLKVVPLFRCRRRCRKRIYGRRMLRQLFAVFSISDSWRKSKR